MRWLLLLTLGLAAALRFWGIGFGGPGKYRPDEEYLVSRALGFHSGDLNPGFFIYPTGYMYALSAVYGGIRLVGEAIGAFGADGFMGHVQRHQYFPIHLYARATTAALGVLGVLATYRLGTRVFGRVAGLMAAALLAVNPAHVRDSHFATTDVPMALLSTLALTAMVGLVERGRGKDYALAGALVGLAVSIKYPAVTLGAPLLVSHLAAPRDEGQRPWSPGPLLLLTASGAAALLAFAALSPYVLLDHRTVARDLAFQAPFLRHGMGDDAPLGLRWLFGLALRHSAGLWLEVLFVAAVLLALLRGVARGRAGAPAALLATFAVALAGSFLPSRWLFVRYVVPLMPVLAVLVAGLALETALRLAPARPSLVAGLLLAAASLEPAARALATTRLLGTRDTRQAAADWIRANVPPGSDMATDRRFPYAKPELPAGYRYVEFSELPAGREGWALVDESTIRRFSPPLPPDAVRLLHQRGRLTAKFDPFRSDRSRAEAVFDPADAFYLPLAGLGGIRQPGPELRLYRVAAEASPPTAASGSHGWLGRYFDNVRWEGPPAHVRVDPAIDFEWKPGPPFAAPLYSVEWAAELHAERAGEYQFRIESDDGAFLYFGDHMVVDNGGEHGPLSKTGSVALEAGDHPVRLRFFNSAYTGQVKLFWTPPAGREHLVPPEVVRPPLVPREGR